MTSPATVNVPATSPAAPLRAWQRSARVDISPDPGFRNATGSTSADFHGVVLTYAGVAAHPALHRPRTTRRRTLVILDVVHHGGTARAGATRCARPSSRPPGGALTGAPFRSDTSPFPFVRDERGPDGVTRSAADSSYGYAEALRDGVVRPVLFLAYSGTATWRTRAGEEVTATLGEPLTVEQTWVDGWSNRTRPGPCLRCGPRTRN